MIYPRLRLSRNRGLPVLSVGDSTYLPHQYLAKFLPLREWSLRAWGGVVILDHRGTRLRLLKSYANTLFDEWGLWNEFYIPPGLEGKTIIDVGAGCGEVSYLYLLKGAKKVICVEANPDAAECLSENAKANRWNVDIVKETFDVSMLSDFVYDFVKIDIEGDEAALLGWSGRLPTWSVIEIHGSDLHAQFSRKWGTLKTVAELSPGRWDRVFLDRVMEPTASPK